MKIHHYAGGFLQERNRFLFGKRSAAKNWAPSQWDIVGGKSLKDEHPLLTLRREEYEEIGIEVMNAELLATLDLKDDNGKPFRYSIYMITAFQGKPVNCSDEHTKIKWFTMDELATKALALPQYLDMIYAWLDQLKPGQAAVAQ